MSERVGVSVLPVKCSHSMAAMRAKRLVGCRSSSACISACGTWGSAWDRMARSTPSCLMANSVWARSGASSGGATLRGNRMASGISRMRVVAPERASRMTGTEGALS
ncbi:hypothetical protein D3C72_1831870 [compost metagenome]